MKNKHPALSLYHTEDLNNCVATSVDHSYDDVMSNRIKASENRKKEIFSELLG